MFLCTHLCLSQGLFLFPSSLTSSEGRGPGVVSPKPSSSWGLTSNEESELWSLCLSWSHQCWLYRGGLLPPLSRLRLSSSWTISFMLFWSCVTATSREPLSRECAIKFRTCCPLHNITSCNIPADKSVVVIAAWQVTVVGLPAVLGRAPLMSPDEEVVCFFGVGPCLPFRCVICAYIWML